MKSPFRYTAIGFAAILSLTLVGCASSGGGSGGGISPEALARNPFAPAGATSEADIRVKTLRVFGDSYSALDYTDTRGTINWATEFGNRGRAERVDNYAIGGARAATGRTNSFDRQIATAMGSNNPVGSGDALDANLTVVYLGYNDIGPRGSGDALRSARAGYFDGLNTLIRAGATSGNNRVFVTQIHDWSRNPRNDPNTASQVVEWNNFVAQQANANPNIVENPTRFGLVNVTTVDTARSPIDALYFDSQHFGNRGQDIISRTFEHYLTRGWEWASSVNAGAEAAVRLNQDIDNRVLLLSHNSKNAPAPAGLSVHAMGDLDAGAPRPLRTELWSASVLAPRADFAGRLNPSGVQTRGVALSLQPDSSNSNGSQRFGVAFHTSQTPGYFNEFHSSESKKSQFNATTMFWHKAVGALDFTTQASFLRNKFDSYQYDDILDTRVANAGAGSTWSLEQRLRHSSRLGNTTLSPWLSLTHLTHTLDGQTAQSIYTTDVRYAASKANDWITGFGLDLRSDPINLGHRKSITFGAGVSHQISLKRDNVGVTMQEVGGFGAYGAVQRETIMRPKLNRTQIGLNATMALSPTLQMQAAFATDAGDQREGHRMSLMANMRF
jgi:hypothetical protein